MTSGLPPNNLAAERSVLAAVLADPVRLHDALDAVAPEDFYGRAERECFALMVALDGDNAPIELVSLLQRARAQGSSDVVTSVWLAELWEEPVPADIAKCAREVRARRRQRDMLGVLRRLIGSGEGHAIDVAEWIAECERAVYDLAQDAETNPPEDLPDVTGRVLETINARTRGEVDYIPTSLPNLNRLISGWVPGRVHYVAATPGNGKTALALQESVSIAEQGFAVAWFSLEMGRDEVVERALSQLGLVDNAEMQRGRIGKDDWRRLGEAAARWNKLPIAIVDPSTITVGGLRSQVRRRLTRLRRLHHADLKLGAIVVDYIQLMDGDGVGEERLSAIANGVRCIAKETGAAIIVISQMNRNSKGDGAARAAKRPMLSDLRGSGQLEQDAHKIIFIHNEYSHLPKDEQTDERLLIVAKNRGGGGTGDCRVRFQGKFTRFVAVDEASCDRLDDDFYDGLGDSQSQHWEDR